MNLAGSFDHLPAEAPFPGVVRRTLDTDEATVTEYTFQPQATFPQHLHPQEQITLLLEGNLRLTAGDETQELAAGDWSVIRGGVPHGITAGDAGARLVAVLVPRRDPANPYELATTPETTEPSG